MRGETPRLAEVVGPEAARLAPPGTYARVAGEYYEIERHPTSHNLTQLSVRFLRDVLPSLFPIGGSILEVGPGRSALLPLMDEAGVEPGRITLLDASPAMLGHSAGWRARGALAAVGDARRLPFKDASFGLAVAVLGDPYNVREFWSEVWRVLNPGAFCLFTGPASEWARAWRRREGRAGSDEAAFELRDGSTVAVPSFARGVRGQVAMVRAAGLRVVAVSELTAADLDDARSPKLDVFGGRHGPLVRGFVLTKPA